MTLTRRFLLTAAACSALSPLAFAEDAAIDVKALNEPPEEGEMALGPDNAKVTMIEYASASCPHCREFYETVYTKLKTDYIDTGKMRFVFREYPHNDPAMAAFMLARCAPKEKYFPMIDVYFQTQDKWLADPLNGLKNIALQSGFTEESFLTCLKNEQVAKAIFAVRDKAEKNFGVTGIPTVFLNGVRMEERDYEAVKKKIDALLAA